MKNAYEEYAQWPERQFFLAYNNETLQKKSVTQIHASQQLVNDINIVRWYECCSLSTLDGDFLLTLT